MKKTAHGPFEVKATPEPADATTERIGAMRMTFEKRFRGDLEATGIVAMIGLMNQELGSGGYVALEKVTGTLGGRAGTFCLQHSSTMERGKPTQSIGVVPDSGTGELAGLRGTLVVEIRENGDHFYDFEYSLG